MKERLNPREVLGAFEAERRPRLQTVSLLAEDPVDVDEAKRILLCLGDRYLWTPTRERRRLLVRHYPACLAFGLVGLAAHQYDGGFWPKVWQCTRVTGKPENYRIWGEAFLEVLEENGLDTFPHLPRRYVNAVLAHAGVPVHFLGDFLRLVLKHLGEEPGVDGRFLVERVGERIRRGHSLYVAKPVEYFLREGGEYAVDFTDRCLDLVRHLHAEEDVPEGIGLPQVIVEELGRLLREDLADLRHVGHRGAAQVNPPRIALDPYVQGVHVVLPPVPGARDGQALWTVTVAGEPRHVRSVAPWVGPQAVAPATVFPIRSPAATVEVRLAGVFERSLSLVDPDDPLLVFAEDGRLVPPGAGLSRDSYWLLVPETRWHALEVKGELAEQEEVSAPYGWEGWSLRRVSLERVTWLGLPKGVRRAVKELHRPRLELSSPVAGVTTDREEPVHAVPPAVVFPAESGAAVTWSVTVRRTDTGRVLADRTLQVREETRFDPWEGLPRPLLGRYEIRVRGPLGRGFTRTVVLVSGLQLHAQPDFRRLTTAGLVPVTVRLTGDLGVSPGSGELRLAQEERSAVTVVEGGREVLELVITPPHAAVEHLPADTPPLGWQTSPVRIETESFDRPGHLLVRVPPGVRGGVMVFRAGSRELDRAHVAEPGPSGVVRVPLDRFADVVRRTRHGEFELDLAGVRMPVAVVRPRRLATAVRRQGDLLVLVDGVDAPGLTVLAYQVWAPWRPPVALPVREGITPPLPKDAVGPLRCLLRVDDPWVPQPVPVWPDDEAHGENVFDVEEVLPPGLLDPVGGAEAEAIAYLAGHGELHPSPELAPYALALHVHADRIAAGVDRAVRADAGAVLAAAPEAALAAVADSSFSGSELVHTLVGSGLVLTRPRVAVDLAVRLWDRSPLAAALASSALIGDPTGRDEARGELLPAATRRCGPLLEKLIDGADDPYRCVGRFGPEVEKFTRRTAAELAAMRRAMRLLPDAGLLDADSRTAAAIQLFEARNSRVAYRVADQAGRLLRAAGRALRATPYARLWAAVEARVHWDRDWYALPALSLALALAARVGARGCAECAELVRGNLRAYADLAVAGPDLVQLDVVLAEALILGNTK
ncbi:hypothetical protein [Carbonactinospora thermoautotrophica]|nr:hypothetical protein [Carbonactinospora thermoautotrophica]